MELGLIGGAPAHVLLVHLVVVLLPLTVLSLLASAIWPSVMSRFGVVLPLLALVALASVPVAVESGEWLEEQIQETPLVEEHAEMGESLWPWALALFVVTAGAWWLYRRANTGSRAEAGAHAGWRVGTPLRAAAVVLSLLVGAGTVVQTYRIGHSGAEATWTDRLSPQEGNKKENGD